jgi:hypothetical protein
VIKTSSVAPLRDERSNGEYRPTRLSGILASRRVREFLLLAPLCLLIFGWPFTVATDPDYWWHVRTGQYIFETGTIPRVDMYSYTATNHPWVAHEWLSELLFYLVSSHAGYVGNVVLFGLICVMTGLAVYVTCRRWGMGEIGAALLMLWSQAMSLASTNVRPQVLTAFLLAVCALLLTLYRDGKTRALWPLPFLFALWVNLHGGYILGLALLGMAVVGAAFAQWLGRPERPWALLGFFAASALATLLNPHGVEAWLYPFTYFGAGNSSMRHIAEWQSPDFHQPIFLLFAASLVLAILVGVGRRPLALTEVLWTVVYAALALQSIRNVPLFAVVVIPLIGARLQEELPILRESIAAWHRPALLVASSALVLWVALVPVLVPAKRASLQLGWTPSSMGYPSGAVAYVRAHHLHGNLFNEYGWGGYLIYNLYPDWRVFIDGRADVYGNAFGERYDQVVTLGQGWREVLDAYDVRVVLIPRTSPLADALASDRDWTEVYSDQLSGLFARHQ